MIGVLLMVAAWPLSRTVPSASPMPISAILPVWQFIGLANYLYLFTDPLWWRAVANTLIFTVVSVGLETALGLIIALALDAHMPGRGLLRAAVLIPWAIPTVVSAKMWGWMLHDLYGVVNALLLSIGLIDRPLAWLADPKLIDGCCHCGRCVEGDAVHGAAHPGRTPESCRRRSTRRRASTASIR